jgi:methylenetetrahydrofolate dehydrogenase (NADP+) / methenyltetrahydrofolate cyclohydrolase
MRYHEFMIIDGKKIADEIQQEIKQAIDAIPTGSRRPSLAVLLAGNHLPSQIYVKRKTEACESVGIHSIKRHLPESISEEDLIREIHFLNHNPSIDGILVQLPLPAHINPMLITQAIAPDKDVDGFHPLNVGKMLIGDTGGFLPCTPLGIQVLMERGGIDVSNKHVLIIGRSNIVGKPMAALLMQKRADKNTTVTIVHRECPYVRTLTHHADIIIIAIGQPHFIKADMIKKGAVIIDVGINKISDPTTKSGYQIVGDVDFDDVKDKCSYITPVPGGVGPMTIAMLLNNTLKSYQRRVTSEE